MVNNALDDGRPQLLHSLGQPRRHTSAMQGKIGMPRALHCYSKCKSLA